MEQLLQSEYYSYEHINGGRKHIGCEDYKIPAALSEHIDYVTPGVKLVSTRAMGDIAMKKRYLASSPKRALLREPNSGNILAKTERNLGIC